MLGRWNSAFALAEGRFKDVRVNLDGFVGNDAATAGALVDTMAGALLHAQLPAPARAALVEYASDGRGEQQTLDGAARSRKLPELAGLILASPAFQIH
jgi:hypothetical protein